MQFAIPLNIGIYSGFRMLSESSFIELSIFRFGVRVFYCRVRVSQTRVRARVRVFLESGFSSRVRVRVRFGFRSMPTHLISLSQLFNYSERLKEIDMICIFL